MGKYVAAWLTAGMTLVLLAGCKSSGGGCCSGRCSSRSPNTYAVPSVPPSYNPPAAAPTSVPPPTSPGYIPPTSGGRVMEGSGSR